VCGFLYAWALQQVCTLNMQVQLFPTAHYFQGYHWFIAHTILLLLRLLDLGGKLLGLVHLHGSTLTK
jgi:hypothetical protein